MTDTFTLYLHFPCFDGVVSAVLASEYLSRKRGWQVCAFMPVDYTLQTTWAASALAERAVVVDFLYHPQAVFWADHHQTSFSSDALRADYERRKSLDLLYDAEAGSCAEVLWRRVYRQLREPRFREMVGWARRIDAARYKTVEDAVWGDAPALRINQSLMDDPSAEYCRYLVEALRKSSLEEVAATPMVARRYLTVRKAIRKGQRLFRTAARVEADGVVVFELPQPSGDAMVSRYAPYLDYPQARYSVGLSPVGERGAKITAMRNPWRRFKSLPLGQIFRSYGGGGHQRVASVVVNDREKARGVLAEIVERIQNGSRPQARRVAEAAAHD